MNSASIINFVTQTGHLIGLAGIVGCLFMLYLQIFRLFFPVFGSWSQFRITRLFALIQRFLWLTWLTGISLLMIQQKKVMGLDAVLFADKMTILFFLVLSTLGLGFFTKRLLISLQGGGRILESLVESLLFKCTFALSVASWSCLVFVVYCYANQRFSHGILLMVGLLSCSVVLALLLGINDRWINARTYRDDVVEIK